MSIVIKEGGLFASFLLLLFTVCLWPIHLPGNFFFFFFFFFFSFFFLLVMDDKDNPFDNPFADAAVVNAAEFDEPAQQQQQQQ